MQGFIKKTLIGTVCVLLFIGVFWHTLTASAFWGLAMYQTKDHSGTRIEPQSQTQLHSQTRISSSTPYQSIRVPHRFTNTDVLPTPDKQQTVFSDLDSNAYYLISPMGTYKDGYLAGHTDKSQSDIEALCVSLSTVYSINPCSNDRSFLEAIMKTSHQTASLFSTAERKNIAATFLLLKSTYVPESTREITPFTTETVSGHLAYDPNDAIAYLFDTEERGYEMVFVHMDQTEIESILASITIDE